MLETAAATTDRGSVARRLDAAFLADIAPDRGLVLCDIGGYPLDVAGSEAAGADDLRTDLHSVRDLALAHAGAEDPRAAIRADLATHFLDRLAAHGVGMPREELLEFLEMDLDLNSQGLAVWLARQAR